MEKTEQITRPTRLTVNDVMGRLERGENILFVDARNPVAWAQSDFKLPGAVRIPADQVGLHARELPRGCTIVTYCT